MCLGLRLAEKCNKESCAELLEKVCCSYPNLKAVGAIYITPDTNIISGMCRADGENIFCDDFITPRILDPVGIGDAFAAGMFYGLLRGESIQRSLTLGACHSILVSTTSGDTSCASKCEVEALAAGNGSFIR